MRKYLVALAALSLTSAVAFADNGSHHPVKDSYITTKIKAELAADPGTKALNIHVATINGVVTLRGMVSSDTAKKRAEQDAKGIDGVREVHNKLKVPE